MVDLFSDPERMTDGLSSVMVVGTSPDHWNFIVQTTPYWLPVILPCFSVLILSGDLFHTLNSLSFKHLTMIFLMMLSLIYVKRKKKTLKTVSQSELILVQS